MPNGIQEQSCFFEARDIYKEYSDHGCLQVLAGINLRLVAGEMVAVVGASGTGKTTLLHILGALDQPSQGQVLYRGENVFEKTADQLA
ncbi:MAG: ATP-binding cassette domain-containing protein, partial [Pseudomonadota bacterium]